MNARAPILLGVALLVAPPASAAGCERPSTVLELSASLQRAEHAFGTLNAVSFRSAHGRSLALLTCLGEIAPPSVAGMVHRHQGLAAFAERDFVAASLAFAAARALDPEAHLAAPRGNPVRDAWSAVDVSVRRQRLVVAPLLGRLVFDGSAGRQRPRAWPTLVQVVRHQRVVHTAWLAPDDAVRVERERS